MFVKNSCRKAFLIAFLWFLAQGSASENPIFGQKVVSEDTYDQVLDLVFPRDALRNRNVRYVFVLRYEPTFQAESQVVIVNGWDRSDIIEYRSLDGNIEMKLDAIVRHTKKEDIKRMAKQIRIQIRHLSVPSADLNLLHDNFFQSLHLSERALVGPKSERVTVTQDGTTYRVWYSGITEIQTDLSGSGIGSPTRADEAPLLDWMKDVHRKLESAPVMSRR